MSTALVLGGGACVWKDVEAALQLGEFAGVVGCNDIGVDWPGQLDAWVSLHPSSFKLWAARRRLKGLPPHRRLFGHSEGKGAKGVSPDLVTDFTDYRLPGQDRSGSSGLFAVKVALIDLGFDRAVLCGIPMDIREAHFFDPEAWRAAPAHRKGWQVHVFNKVAGPLPILDERVRSMSGWTAELLGKPDADWIV